MTTTAIPTQAHFSTLLTAMRDHYKGGAAVRYDLEAQPEMIALRTSLASTRSAPLTDSGTIPPVLSGIAADAKAGSQASYDSQKTGAQSAADTAKQDQNQDSFKAKMAAQCAKAKQDSDANIDKAYASATTVGEANPDQQDAILSGMNQIMGLLNDVIGGLVNVISTIISGIEDILKGLLDVAEKFAPVAEIIALF